MWLSAKEKAASLGVIKSHGRFKKGKPIGGWPGR
jgi:hypothetical protein